MTWFFDSLKGGYWPPRQRSSGHFQTGECFRQHRAIRQEVSDIIFAPIQSLENEGILYMYFWFFKLKKWGKKTAETGRRNCAVLPYSGFFPGRDRVRIRLRYSEGVTPSLFLNTFTKYR